ncbi:MULTISPECIES: YidH family protein [unclassified Synechococcus]|uniref:YidH family protein n=1 Tax=unclassified Synechococcus TaxID=2626047 RepID=UPI0039AEC44B
MSNPNTELAKTRNRAAAERTTLAWIRTALALISFGFGLDKIISAIRVAGGDADSSNDMGLQLMSMGFIGIGIFTLLIAMRQHKRELIRLRNDPYLYREEPSLSIAAASAVLVIGVMAFGLLLAGFI